MEKIQIEIREVESLRELKRFVEFPNQLYKNSKYFVPALSFDELNTLRKDKNPAFEYCEAKYWLAYKQGQIVGRIAGIISHAAIKKWGTTYARFGWIDFIDDHQVVKTLFETVENWAISKGMNGVHGPLGFTDMDKEGMLTEGFEEMNQLGTIYNYAYYPTHLEQLGYKKDAEWLQFELTTPAKVPEKFENISNLVIQKYGLKILKTRKASDFLPYVDQMFEVLNQAYEKLYGTVTLTPTQIKAYTKQYFGFIRHDYVCFVLDGTDKLIAFAITMPSFSRALQKAKGHLFPFGFIHLLRAMWFNEHADLYLIGVIPEYQNKGVNAVVFNEITKR